MFEGGGRDHARGRRERSCLREEGEIMLEGGGRDGGRRERSCSREEGDIMLEGGGRDHV